MILTETMENLTTSPTSMSPTYSYNRTPSFIITSPTDAHAPTQITTKEQSCKSPRSLESNPELEQTDLTSAATSNIRMSNDQYTTSKYTASSNSQPSETPPEPSALDIPEQAAGDRPNFFRYHSSPSLPSLSPTRHQFRIPNTTPRHIKETLNASLKIDETGRTINQYQVQHAVGRGSFGTVWLVVDTTTGELYAMKEYSKSTLRRRKQSELMRQRRLRHGSPQFLPSDSPEDNDISNPINLIRREVAIMKKVDHPNVVRLIEVLDDPTGDSLYMILEWCKKGPIMGPDGLQARYTEEECRVFFRDLILGIEYLHSQGIIHRDIKTDNLLLDEDDVVKIADFGVSELLDPNNDRITKTAGSPAYMAPELAALSSNTDLKETAINKGIDLSELSGKSTDIWSMGVTLYQLLFGRLPFRSESMVDLFDQIVNEEVVLPSGVDPHLKDLFDRILERRPQKRISMDTLRKHPWVTCAGADPLLSREENTASCMTPVTEEDLHYAIELVEGLMEPAQAIAKLRRLHGWHDYDEKDRGRSLSPKSESQRARSTSPASETSSLYNLTRALQEVLTKSNKPRSKSAFSTPPGYQPQKKSEPALKVNTLLNANAYEEPAPIKTNEETHTDRITRKPSRLRARYHEIQKMGTFRSKSLNPETRF